MVKKHNNSLTPSLTTIVMYRNVMTLFAHVHYSKHFVKYVMKVLAIPCDVYSTTEEH